MPGEVDKLQVKIEASAKGALKNVDYLISKLGDLRKVSGITADSLHAVNVELRDMSNYLKGIKSVGDPFAGFSRGASKAAENARKVGDAMRRARKEAEPMQKMEIVPVKPGALKAVTEEMGGFVERVKDAVGAFNRFRAEWEAWRAATGRAAIGGSTPLLEDSKIIDGMPWSEYREDSWRDTVESPKLLTMVQSIDQATESTHRFRDALASLSPAFSRISGWIMSGVFKAFTFTWKALGVAVRTGGKAILWVASAPFKLLGKAVSSATHRLTGFLKSIMRIAMYRAIRSALRALTQGLSEGTENLYFFSQAVGSNFAPSMDRLATSMLYLKNGFAAMFSPLVEYFTPLIETLVDKLVDAFNWVQRLFAQLTGKTTWNKAVKVQTVYKEATDNTAKSVKKLRQEIQLMDFDELNNITDNPDDGSSASTPEVKNPDPVKMFTIEPTNVNPYDEGSFFANLKAWWNDIDPIGWLWEKVSGWWNGIDFEEAGRKAGEAVRKAWEDFEEWFETFDWKGLWDGFLGILSDIGDWLKGFLRGLFPEYFAQKDKEDAALKTENESYEERKEILFKYDNSFDENAHTLDEINEDISKLAKTRSKIEQQIDDYFDGDLEKKRLWDEIVNNRTTTIGAKRYEDMLNNPDFKAYTQLLTALEENGKAIDKLKKKRQELATKTLANTNKEKRAFYSVSQSLEEYGKDVQSFYNELATQMPQNAAYITAQTISEFKEADWRDGGILAMEKLKKALIMAGIPKEARELALQAAAKFGAEKGWTTWTANAATLIENALWAANIPDEYVDVARTALKGYLTYVNWGNGGKISAEGVMKAFKEAGLPDGVAEVAERAALDYLSAFDGQDVGKGAVDDVKTGMERRWGETKPTLTADAKVDTSKIPGDMNKFLKGIPSDATWKKLPMDLKIATQNKELVAAVNKKINELNKEGVKLSQVELEALIRTTADELGIEIDNLIDKTKPKALVVPVKFSGKGVPKLVDDKNPYSGFTMENFARGGFPEMGTMFVAGEMAGQAEMVGNINGRTGVASGQEITGIGDAVWSTGGTTARLISELIEVVREKNLTISPSAALGRTVAKSQRMYATQTG